MPPFDIYVNKPQFYNLLKLHRIFFNPKFVEICEKIQDKKKVMDFRQAVKKKAKGGEF
jgi:hypothetical protein